METETSLKKYWIVYLTENTITHDIYIGTHQTDNPLKFDYYIGCGVYTNKPQSYNHPKTKFQHAVKTFGPKVFKRTILKVFDNVEDAYFLESELVDKEFLMRKDVYNMVLGGGMPKDTSIKCYCYDLDGNFVKEYLSITDACKDVKRGRTTVGRALYDKTRCANSYWSFEKVDKLDLQDYHTDTNKVMVYQYSNLGEYETEYESCSDAAISNNCTSGDVCRSCKLGYLVNDKYFSYIKSDQFSKAKSEYIGYKKPVYQYSLDGSFIKEFESATDARRILNIKNDIGVKIRTGGICGGFQWSYEKLDRLPDRSKDKYTGHARKVAVYDLNGRLVEIFDTVTKCQQKYSGCKHVLHGKRKTANGHTFKYIN